MTPQEHTEAIRVLFKAMDNLTAFLDLALGTSPIATREYQTQREKFLGPPKPVSVVLEEEMKRSKRSLLGRISSILPRRRP